MRKFFLREHNDIQRRVLDNVDVIFQSACSRTKILQSCSFNVFHAQINTPAHVLSFSSRCFMPLRMCWRRGVARLPVLTLQQNFIWVSPGDWNLRCLPFIGRQPKAQPQNHSVASLHRSRSRQTIEFSKGARALHDPTYPTHPIQTRISGRVG